MTSGAIDRVAVKLTQTKEIDIKCYPPVKELFNLIPDYFSGEANGSFGDVVISNTIPDPDDVNKLWVATNGQRNTFEARFYINGKWQPWYFLAPNQFVFFDGRATLPAGFKEIGRFKSIDIPITDTSGTAALPGEIIIARFIGY